MMYYLGLDIGTTGTKALLIGDDGSVTASAMSGYPTYSPRPLWSEQHPEEWWTATCEAVRSVLRAGGIPAEKIYGIGLTGQMHGLVAMGTAGNVLRPCIMWNDQRTASECAEIVKDIGIDSLLKITGNQVLPGFTAPKILWIKNNEPAVYSKIAHILLPKDYIRYRMTGEFATDVSDASGTSLLDVGKRGWASSVLSRLAIPEKWMPSVYESVEITGKVTAAASNETGLRAGIPVVAGAGDQAAGGIGNGIVTPGIAAVTIGTSGVVFAHTDRLVVEKNGLLHAFCHAVPGKWHLMGVTLSAGGSLRWFRDTLGEPERLEAQRQGADPYDILSAEAGTVKPGSDGLLFLPYLSGERTPYPDPSARGAFVGLTTRHTRCHLVRSVMEGVAYSLLDCLVMMKKTGLDVGMIRISGGGARSPVWRQIIADVFGTEVVTLAVTDGAPYGAAILAAVGTGRYQSCEEACSSVIKPMTATRPDKNSQRIYAERYPVYRSLYPAFTSSFTKLTIMEE